jgi:glyoxylase-like metal-dependent hydrolase (beta-lactamase superfamily II)
MQPFVQSFFDHATNTISYIVHDPATKKAAIIDPVLDFTPRNGRIATTSADALLTAVSDQGLDIIYLLETHAHADHLSAAHHLREVTGAPVVIGAQITQVQTVFGALFEADDVTHDGAAFDRLVDEGDTLRLGDLTINVLHTPGHTPACVTYVIGDAAFVGDTMFMPDYGTARADFPGGDARTLYRSIRRLLSLPGETRLFLCHDYKAPGRDEYRWETTVDEQRRSSVHVHDAVSEDAFVAMREQRDAGLAVPRLLLPSIQVNIRAGRFHEAADNGVTYLRIPVKPRERAE